MSRFAMILCKNSSVGSGLLRFAMWSRWSHSAILDRATGVVYDSTMTHGGCRKWTTDEFAAMYPHMEIRGMDVLPIAEVAATAWLEAQLGKKYDWTALVGFLIRRDWQEDDVWFCSEHTETFRSLFEVRRFRIGASRITPHHQDMIE